MRHLIGNPADLADPESIRLARTSIRGLTQARLAESVGRSRALISAWELGSRRPGCGDLAKLAEIFARLYYEAAFSPKVKKT